MIYHPFDKIIVYLAVILFLENAIQASSVNGPALFNKDEKLDKLLLSNQIGYHFKKVVREVSQELFVARKIDVSSLFLGISMLKQTQEGLSKYCKDLSFSVMVSKPPEVQPKGYVHIKIPQVASFPEAKARCEARGMQLPEIYDKQQSELFTMFLKNNNLGYAFAGIQPDIVDSTQRFISTGLPFWHAYHDDIVNTIGNKVLSRDIIDDINAEFLYSNKGNLVVVWENPTAVYSSGLGDPNFRSKQTEITQYNMPIVCEPKWTGITLTDSVGQIPSGLTVNRRYGRSIPTNNTFKISRSAKDTPDSKSIKSLKEYCSSVAIQSGEIHLEMLSKIRDLLSLVDISVQLENTRLDQRDKRSPFIARFLFSNGARLIWNIYGLIQRMRMSARIDRLEDSLTQTQANVDANSKAINNMSLILYGHSIAIDQLKITTADLDRRLTEVERKLTYLEVSMHDLAGKVENVVFLSLISSLILRIQQSLNTGYDTLKDIIHSSLLGQTSPLLLPIDQVRLVQNEVQKVSVSILDTDFAKMQSIVVTDPQDSHLLLVVINAAAVSRRNLELIKLVPVPYYEGSKAFIPILDYQSILLDQLARTYSVLSEQEEYDCLTNRCYVSDIEHSVNERTCGIPQWFNQHLDICVFQETLSDGVFLKPMLPDGILFAVRGEVTTQLFCKENTAIGPIRKLNGTGTMQLPNGCTLSVTDKLGRNTKVRGQPISRMVNAEAVDLTINGPLNMLQTISSLNSSQKMMIHGTSINDHLSSVVRQVEVVDLQLQDQKLYIWILIGIIGVIITILFVIVIIAYNHKGKFYLKIRELRSRYIDVHQALTDAERRPNTSFSPIAPPRPDHIQTMAGNKSRSYLPLKENYDNDRRSPSYVTVSETQLPRKEECLGRDNPHLIKPSIRKEVKAGTYPRLTPLFDELSVDRLNTESSEVEKLCNQKFLADRY